MQLLPRSAKGQKSVGSEVAARSPIMYYAFAVLYRDDSVFERLDRWSICHEKNLTDPT